MNQVDFQELKAAVIAALQSEQTAIDVFKNLAGIHYDISADKRTPCALNCSDPGRTRMYLIRYTRTRGDWRLKCDRCGTVWDAIEAVKHAHACDYPEAVALIGSMLGLTTGRSGKIPAAPKPKPVTKKAAAAVQFDVPEGEDQLPFYLECRKRLEQSPAAIAYLEGRRKIPLELARKYWIGFTPNVIGVRKKDGRSFYAGPGLIFPITRYQWEARIIEDKPIGPKAIKHGAAGVWNWRALKQHDRPVYITEGVFNALTILWDAQKHGEHKEAVAIGGVSNVEAFINRLVSYRKEAPLPPLIAAFDDDEPGRKATEELARLSFYNKIEINQQFNYTRKVESHD